MQTRAAAVVLALVLAACGADVRGPTPSAPSASAPVASPSGFRADVERIRADLEALQAIADANSGVRTVGTAGFEASVDETAAELKDIGFTVETPSVAFTGFRELAGGRLEVGGRAFSAPDELHALIYSPGADVTGQISVLEESGCAAQDFAGVPEGAIALTTIGGCFRRDQAINAAEAGAAALVVGYPGRGPSEIYRPTLIDPSAITIPVVSVTGDAVDALTAAEGEEAHLAIETEREPATMRNVIAQLGDGPSVVMLGAHLDSVLDGPGINDNGSGVAALLEIARGLASEGVPDGWAVRIGLWGGEEFGSIGSRAYVDGMEDEVVAYLNVDMAGSPNGSTLVYDEAAAPPGSERITLAYEAWLEARGEDSERVDIGGSSDHFAFIQAGIPIGGLFAGASESGSAAQPAASASTNGPADACYHLACDDIDNVDVDRVALFAEATHDVALQLMRDS